MTQIPQDKDHNLIAVKLDAERRKEIDDVRKSFELFYRDEVKFQAEIKNSLNMMAQKQDSLKERFESGTASTLRELRKDFSTFLMEWGKKQEQDRMRDVAINSADKKADSANKNVNWLTRALILSVCSGIFAAVIIYALKNFGG